METQDVERCAAAYNRMMQRKKELEAQVDAVVADMDAMKALVLDHFQQNNIKSMKTEHGDTLSIRVTSRYSTADFVHFCEWARQRPDAMGLFEKRLHQGNVLQWLKEYPEDVPPGLSSHDTTSLVFKPAKKE